MTSHQYEISALISQTSIRGKLAVASRNVGFLLRLCIPFVSHYHSLVLVCSLKIAQPGDDPFLRVWHILTGYYSVSSNPQNTTTTTTNKQWQMAANKQMAATVLKNIITDNYPGIIGL